MNHYEHPFSWHALIRIVTVVVTLFLIWRLQEVIIIILVSLLLASSLYPMVRALSKYMSVASAATLITVLLIAPFAALSILLVSRFLDQAPDLIATFSAIIKKSTLVPQFLKLVDLNQYAERGASYLLNSTSRLTTFVTSALSVVFLSLYVLIDIPRLRRILFRFIPEERRHRAQELLLHVVIINGHYIRGNLFISLICCLCISVGLLLFHIPYAIPLGIFAGILDLLPLVGAFIGAAPAMVIGFAISPLTGFFVLALIVIYQQIENSILAPNIYNKALDLSPALSFVAVIVGTALLGISGAFLALPIAASVPSILSFFVNHSEAKIKKV